VAQPQVLVQAPTPQIYHPVPKPYLLAHTLVFFPAPSRIHLKGESAGLGENFQGLGYYFYLTGLELGVDLFYGPLSNFSLYAHYPLVSHPVGLGKSRATRVHHHLNQALPVAQVYKDQPA
jgi:hypothetical protein